MEILLKLLALLYLSTGIISTLGYIPTIKDLLHRIKSANIPSYVIWTLTGLIAYLYAFIIIKDLFLEIVTGLSFALCAIILTLALKLKNKK